MRSIVIIAALLVAGCSAVVPVREYNLYLNE